MKNKRFGFIAILAFAALASSCGTSAYYSNSAYSDGIYYRPTQESRAKMIAEKEAKASRSQYDQYLARDEEGNLYVVTELMDGETYESRLRKFDSPWYTNPYWYDTWSYAWYDSWYGYRPYYAYGYYPYYGYYGYYYPYGYYSPYWYSPWAWGGVGYAGWYAWNRWYDYPYHHHYYPSGGYGPGPGPSKRENVVYTPRNSNTGSGMYRNTGNAGNRGMYTTHRTSSGGSVSTRTSNSGTTTVRSSNTSRPARTGASRSSSSSSGSYTRSSGSYSSGGSAGRSSGGGYSGGGSSGGGTSVSGGTHSGGGRR